MTPGLYKELWGHLNIMMCYECLTKQPYGLYKVTFGLICFSNTYQDKYRFFRNKNALQSKADNGFFGLDFGSLVFQVVKKYWKNNELL